MPDPRSVLKEFRSLDQKRRSQGLSGEEEARFLQLCDIVGPEPSPPPKPGFDVNSAAAELRASLEPAGLRRRSPEPAVPPEPLPDPLEVQESAPDLMGISPELDPNAVALSSEPAIDFEAAPLDPNGYENPPADAGWDDSSAFAQPLQPADEQGALEPESAAPAALESDPYAPVQDDAASFAEVAPTAEQVDFDSEWQVAQNDPLEPAFTEIAPDGAENPFTKAPDNWEPELAEAVPEFELAASGSFGLEPAVPAEGEPLGDGFADASTPAGDAPLLEPLADPGSEWAATAAEAQPFETAEWVEPAGQETPLEAESWEGLPGDSYPQPEGGVGDDYPISTEQNAEQSDWSAVNDSQTYATDVQEAVVPQDELTEWSAEQDPQAAAQPPPAEQETLQEEAPGQAADPLEWLEVFTPEQDAGSAAGLEEHSSETTESPSGFSVEQTDRWAVAPSAPSAIQTDKTSGELEAPSPGLDSSDLPLASAADFIAEAASAQTGHAQTTAIPTVISEVDPNAPTLELTEQDAILSAEPEAEVIVDESSSSESLDSPKPAHDHGGPSPTFVQGSHRVVIHTLDGQVKRGTLADVDLDAGEVPVMTEPSSPPERIPVATIKAIFFMLPPGEKPVATSGKRVRVTFGDGRQVAGFSDEYRPEDVGFFMIPADTRTNTARIWVYREATRQVAVT